MGGIVEIDGIRIACRVRSRMRGLLGRGAAGDGGCAIVLAPCRDIHTFGMRAPIDVAFVSEEGVVLLARRDLPPRKRLCCRGSAYVVERFSDSGSAWFEGGERVSWSVSSDDSIYPSGRRVLKGGGYDEEVPRMRCDDI